MTQDYLISKENWDKILNELLGKYDVFAPVAAEDNQDYRFILQDDIHQIIYNTPKPATPLKTFFLPVKENVVKKSASENPRLIIGSPSCDLAGLDLLDKIYLEEPFVDKFYQQRRENTILVGTSCFSTLEHCHCSSYGIKPFPEKNHDISLSVLDGQVTLQINSNKGKNFFNEINHNNSFGEAEKQELEKIDTLRVSVTKELSKTNQGLPDYSKTGELIKDTKNDIWEKYAKTCVSCGACASICPTCTCFLLIDRPGFEKIRQLDGCQYPGFEQVAAGEDPLEERFVRFRNRYLCKYVWKPEKYESIACTGCGRCIEACIGNINKNELFRELLT
jgi:ferredoxin